MMIHMCIAGSPLNNWLQLLLEQQGLCDTMGIQIATDLPEHILDHPIVFLCAISIVI